MQLELDGLAEGLQSLSYVNRDIPSLEWELNDGCVTDQIYCRSEQGIHKVCWIEAEVKYIWGMIWKQDATIKNTVTVVISHMPYEYG